VADETTALLRPDTQISMAMVDFDPYQLPHRKPVPVGHGANPPATNAAAEPANHGANQPARSHAHSRTVSSSIFPNPVLIATSYQPAAAHNRRTPSNATSSSAGSGTLPIRTSSTVSINLRRSTSTRSGQSCSPSSYVALMRKQKATVWCDRSQHQDPRAVAQAKAAKMQAAMEVVGSGGRTGTGLSVGGSNLGVRSKIRHHGGPKAIAQFSPANANLVGASVPMRLSASEVGDEDNSDDDGDSQRNNPYQRNGSARSSMASNQRLAVYNQRSAGRHSQGSTPPSGQGSSPLDPAELGEANTAERPGSGDTQRKAVDYFVQPGGNGGSGSSSERESGFGNVGELKPPGASRVRKDGLSPGAEELSRRGSVDERSSTMRGVRLFVANPDLTD
jgi:hypothetical protein